MARRKIETIGFLGVYRDAETDEYVVRPLADRDDEAAYFTTDREDAIGTARAWLQDAMENAERKAGWDASR